MRLLFLIPVVLSVGFIHCDKKAQSASASTTAAAASKPVSSESAATPDSTSPKPEAPASTSSTPPKPAATDPVPPEPTPASIKGAAGSITGQTVDYKPEPVGTCETTGTYIKLVGDAAIVDPINAALRKWGFVDEPAPGELPEECGDEGGTTDDWTQAMHFINDRVVSFTMMSSLMFKGAAHPTNSGSAKTFLLETGEELQVRGLFKQDTDVKAVLSRLAIPAIKANPDFQGIDESTFDDADAVSLGEEGVAISNGGMYFPNVFYYPHVISGIDVTIPWADLKPHLADGVMSMLGIE